MPSTAATAVIAAVTIAVHLAIALRARGYANTATAAAIRAAAAADYAAARLAGPAVSLTPEAWAAAVATIRPVLERGPTDPAIAADLSAAASKMRTVAGPEPSIRFRDGGAL